MPQGARTIAEALLGDGAEFELPLWLGAIEDALKANLGSQPTGRHAPGSLAARRAVRLNGAPVKDRISSGQQKLLAATLLMAQLDLFLPGGSDAADLVAGEARVPLAAGALVAVGSSRRLAQLLIRALGDRSV